jgi:DNA recombination protein Rad52
MFTPEQTAMLEGLCDKANVKSRAGPNGKRVSYLEGWYVVDLANEIFGFGNWDAETVDMRREHDPVHIPPSEERPKGGIVVSYSAKVRVTVYGADGTRKVVRERCGGHRGEGSTVGEAIENTIKAAETDATKRAFVTFGNVFGLALYDKEQRNVGTPEPRPAVTAASQGSPRALAAIEEGFGETRPTVSERALAASSRPAGVNGVQPRIPY